MSACMLNMTIVFKFIDSLLSQDIFAQVLGSLYCHIVKCLYCVLHFSQFMFSTRIYVLLLWHMYLLDMLFRSGFHVRLTWYFININAIIFISFLFFLNICTLFLPMESDCFDAICDVHSKI